MKRTVYFVAMFALITAPVMAQNWDEATDGGGDAGIQNAAQVTVGASALTSISGSLDQAGGDHVDCYVIQVTDVTTFYVTSDPGVDPNAVVGETDTRLWIFDGLGAAPISANDDSPSQTGFLSVVADPTLGPITYTATPVNPVTTSLADGTNYVICYSYYANDPEDAAANDLVPIGTAYEAMNGPDPAAGAFSAWENTGTDAAAAYTIALAGAGTSDVPVELQSFSIE